MNRYFSYLRMQRSVYVIVQARKNYNEGNLYSLNIKKKDLKLDDQSKINRRGRRRLGVVFENYKAANNFAEKNRTRC